MKIDLEKYKGYDIEYNRKYGKNSEVTTLSITEAIEHLTHMKEHCELNHKDPSETPVFIKYDDMLHVVQYTGVCHSNMGVYGEIETSPCNKFSFIAPDIEDPISTNVEWKSHGVSDGLDVSGFVNSRASGIRLLHMVQEVLGSEETKSFLDYREREPNWIQFKFYPKEFDVYKIDKLSKEAGRILNKEILAKCKVK